MTGAEFELVGVAPETPDIRRFVLAPVTGPVPVWSAGAHVRVGLPTGGDRAYSLLRLPGLPENRLALGVLREPASSGGSVFMHGLQPGDRLQLSPPANHFPLRPHRAAALLLAGGIGITPILSMAAELARAARPFTVHYAGRRAGGLAFVAEMREICGDRLHLHHDDRETALDIPAVLAAAPAGAHAYVCGPAGMMEAVQRAAAAQGWAGDRLHFELFTAAPAAGADEAFEVEIHRTGQVVPVPADRTIVQALEDAGLEPLYDCQRGDCGVCRTRVTGGLPDHRDVVLTEAERAAGDVMQICVSRSRTPRLVLDIDL